MASSSGVGSKRALEPAEKIVEQHVGHKKAVWRSLVATIREQRAELDRAAGALADKAEASVRKSGDVAMAKLEALVEEARKVQKSLDDEKRACLAQAQRDESEISQLHKAHKAALTKSTDELKETSKAATSAETAQAKEAVARAAADFAKDVEKVAEVARGEIQSLAKMAEELEKA